MVDMTAYYNEHDPFAAAWLRELIAEGHIAGGHVDERDIQDVQPADLAGFVQCHFFAGIGGWSLALRLAGWPDDRPVWTGSCPCQPFSLAGKGEGVEDERHLWPAWFRLIRECRPAVVFGEQVTAAVQHGWVDLVSADLEGITYAFGAADLPAASVGAPQRRQRLFFVADRAEQGRGAQPERPAGADGRSATEPGRLRDAGGVDDTDESRPQGRPGGAARQGPCTASPGDGHWSDLVWLPCRDGKARPTRPGLLPLASGVPNRVGALRGAGNAIVPQVASVFIQSYREARGEEV